MTSTHHQTLKIIQEAVLTIDTIATQRIAKPEDGATFAFNMVGGVLRAAHLWLQGARWDSLEPSVNRGGGG